MSEAVNPSEPVPMNSEAPPLAGIGGVNHETHGTHERAEWRERAAAAMAALMERKVTPRELRVLWQVLEWSFGLQREATRPFTGRDMVARTGLTPPGVSRALKGLKEKHIIRKSADGGWQFTPESKFRVWLVPWRVDEEKRMATRRVDEAQGVEIRDQRPEVRGQPENGGTGDENQEPEIGDWKTAKKQNGEQPTKRGTNMKEQDADDHGTHETHGAQGSNGDDGVFLPPDVANLTTPATDAPLKSFPPSSKTPFNTIHNLLKGEEPVVSLATELEAKPVEGNGTEAGMEMGSVIPEDPMDASEDTLMRRLMGLLGEETMKKKGGSLRLFIRGSVEAADCPDTAVAMRKAINDTEAAQREGRIKKSVFGYLYRQAFYWAGQMGWKFDAAKKEWTKGEKFNNWKHLNANRRRK
jgi:DNA-binding transcriptional ArsR family regulator